MVWFVAWYNKHLRDWAESYLAEIAKGVIVLLGLVVFRVVIFAVRMTGEDPDNIALLLQLHFWLTYATIGVLGLYSLFKLIGSML